MRIRSKEYRIVGHFSEDAILGSEPGRLRGLRTPDHHFGGFDERDGAVARLEGQFANGVGGDDGGDALVADGEDDFGQQASMTTSTTVPSSWLRPLMRAGARMSRRGGQELFERFEGNAVVAAGGLDGPDAPGQNPVLEGGIADADFFRGLARREQSWTSSWDVRLPPFASTLQRLGAESPTYFHVRRPCAGNPVTAITRQRWMRMIAFRWLFPSCSGGRVFWGRS